ncbi:HD domain-containing protein [Alloalcanivorax xenomutans]|jgi:predicted HD phosphohydrolase|uniref:HD domain-containing protein n=1 Tax=Alloalcanivorax xenomutans TaxID=1094342 RepID=A0A9Q3W8Z1_9GAMM|nr:HD domain-containing protein [Alloalcanivorax xenomutans]ERS14712.1 phosphohydrolase [Alcanivorax sp. PN-3]KYZ86073.1 phosphohydrolase [Alcanivorax sp. KX64203]MBA4720116.1 HD domain-containing protein [Alcanivorax sp.]ARB44439.1 phosphohydrolase [Alloalcanivorax xenomutans]MCE7511338.1 HD domain-containing protein [Alloalcanivorax xenomutans]|tara:strand:- start:612 stop:1220 length:609 start_codon:yes stop_codon:yes gene_type:complete
MQGQHDELRASFTHMEDGKAEDWQIISDAFGGFARELPDRVIEHLRLLEGDCGGFPVDRLTHCLQTATLAHQDGKDEEYVVCALLHDIGDTLGPYNHADIAASLLEPFVSEENHWMVKHHAIFQGYYFFHHLGLDRNLRDQFRDHPCFERTVEFCAKYDGAAFDPEAETLPLSFFEPMLRRVMEKPKRSLYKKTFDKQEATA